MVNPNMTVKGCITLNLNPGPYSAPTRVFCWQSVLLYFLPSFSFYKYFFEKSPSLTTWNASPYKINIKYTCYLQLCRFISYFYTYARTVWKKIHGTTILSVLLFLYRYATYLVIKKTRTKRELHSLARISRPTHKEVKKLFITFYTSSVTERIQAHTTTSIRYVIIHVLLQLLIKST